MNYQISNGDELDLTEEGDLLQLVAQLVQKVLFTLVQQVVEYGKQLIQVLHGKIFQMDILVDL